MDTPPVQSKSPLSSPNPAEDTTDYAEAMNQARDGWSKAMGLRYVRATPTEVVVEFEVAKEHLQAYGVVHGGVYSGVLETISSVGAAISAMASGQHVVGLENHTSFLRAVRTGTLRASAKPLVRGKKTHVWEGNVTDEQGRLVASGRVRLLCLSGDSQLGGTGITLQVG